MAVVYFLFSLACLSLLSGNEARHRNSKDGIFIAAGKYYLLKTDSIAADTHLKFDFYTNKTNKLVMNCEARLGCSKTAYMEVFRSNGSLIQKFCSKQLKMEVMPESISDYEMKIAVYSGDTTRSRYDCQVWSKALPKPIIINPGNETCQCGNLGGPRIIGGQPVGQGEIPWQVALGQKYDRAFHIFCGGTLISAKHILSTAHCANESPVNFTAFLGNVNLTSKAAVFIRIKRWALHEQFGRPVILNNNIAVLFLENPVTLTANIFPACLPRGQLSLESFAEAKMTASGWGTTRAGMNEYPTILQSTTVYGMQNFFCENSYPKQLTENMLCASASGNDTCGGDVGGPLTYNTNGVTYLVGITSGGALCGSADYPGVYTRVTKYLDWIDSKTDSSICSR